MRRDIPYCLALMNIYVQPSRFEGVPNSVLEAMASGLPVVATDVGGVQEVVQNGKTGLLVDPDNDTQLIEAIESLIAIADKRRALGALALKRVTSRFSIQKMVSDYEHLYGELVRS